MAHLSLALLGPFQAALNGQSLTSFESVKARALLVYLAVEADRPHARETLAGLLWPDSPNQAALTTLRHTLASLRQTLGDREAESPFLLVTRETVQFNPASDYDLDLEGVRTLGSPQNLRGLATDRLEQIIARRRGSFLEGFSCDSAPFEEWLVSKREQINRQVLDALTSLVTHYEQRGDTTRAITWGRKQLELELWDESAHQALMRALTLSGQRSAALAQYDACRHVLQQELKAQPSPETVRLYERIRDGTFPDQAAAQVSALLPSASPAARPRHNLPAQLSSFVGREKEIAEVKQKLTEGRLVTLTGAGGVGKTRLAIQVAAELVDTGDHKDDHEDDHKGRPYEDGVWLAELAPLADPALVPQAVTQALGLPQQADRPPQAMLTDYFREKTALLVLDNCEHLIEACAQLAEALLTACPNLHLLATSREALGLNGEASFRVPSLSLPPVEPGRLPPTERLSDYEAVWLFVERAASALPGFAVTPDNAAAIAQVCQRLDGIPLALELAAARVQVLRVEQIAARLEDGFQLLTGGSRTALPRQRTLRAAIDWSYELLSDEEQVLLRRLSVFSGGWTLEAAEAVAGAEPLSPDAVLDLLTALVNKSLVVAERKPGHETRYRLLETIRQYAHEKLAESVELLVVRDRHLDYFLKLAQEFALHVRNKQRVWLDRLEAEFDNVRAAWEHALANDAERALRLAQAVEQFRYGRGGFQEQRVWLARLLPITETWRTSKGRAIALRLAGRSAQMMGDDTAARPLLESSLAVARMVGDKPTLAKTLDHLANIYIGTDRRSDERAWLEESLALSRELGDAHGIGHALASLAVIVMGEGDALSARALYEQALAAFQSDDDQKGISLAMRRLGRVALATGDYTSARTLLDESLSRARKEGDKWDIEVALLPLGHLARLQGDFAEAAAAYAKCLRLDDDMMGTRYRPELLTCLGFFTLQEGDYAGARRRFEEALSIWRSRALFVDMEYGVMGLAGVLAATGKSYRAAQLLGQVQATFQSHGVVIRHPIACMEYDRILSTVRAQLDEATFNAAWAEGQAMTQEQAIALALEESGP